LSSDNGVHFRPFSNLLISCPICASRGRKILCVRKTAVEWAVCPVCDWHCHPADCKCKDCAERNQRESFAHVMDCPKCEELGHKVPCTRDSLKDWGICTRCGWRWHPGKCRCKDCSKFRSESAETSSVVVPVT
jgi:hypothetical protein